MTQAIEASEGMTLHEVMLSLADRISALEAKLGEHACCGTDRPESCGDKSCERQREFDNLERLHLDLTGQREAYEALGPSYGAHASLDEHPKDSPLPSERELARMNTSLDA